MTSEREPLPTHVRDTEDLPAGYHATLDAGLSALGLVLDADARRAIDGHLRLLLAWTTAINLTGVRDPVVAATAHVLDSLSAVAVMRERGLDHLLDLGSGGGFPGIPLAAALPASAAMLVEPIGKKARFLATAVDAVALQGRVRIAATRAETLAADPRHRGAWRAVTARAVASMAELVELSFPLLVPGGVLIAWKRGDLHEELAIARSAIAALGGGSLESLDVAVPGLDGHRLVLATRTGRVPDDYPRDPAARRRRPW
ncbi:MAG: 16S rRNA (guanine(527)-N(7))-methyltransferase RsmG [Chloroflexota bacterium]